MSVNYGKALTKAALLHVLLLGATLFPINSEAQTFASAERASIALGHYARARALLVEALAEFERGRQVARPDILLDPEEWRISVVSRTEELNRLLDPQPRVTRSGAQYQANKHLIRRDSETRMPVPSGAQDSNVYGERQRNTELERARLAETNSSHTGSERSARQNTAHKANQPKVTIKKRQATEPSHARRNTLSPESADSKVTKAVSTNNTPKRTQDDSNDSSNASKLQKAETTVSDEKDIEISNAIEKAFQARIERLKNIDTQK